MFTITLKNGHDIELLSFSEADQLPAASREYIWEYGFRQAVNDSTAPVVKKSFDPKDFDGMDFIEAVDGYAAKRLDAIMNGDVGRRQAADPKRAAILKTARAVEAASPEVQAEIARLLGQ